MAPAWDELASGAAVCPMDHPLPANNQFVYFVRKLTASSLYLDRNQAYRGRCVLIYDLGHAIRIDQLSPEQWLELAADIRTAEVAIFKTFQPDHMNVESLGNGMPHLHWHIIPRFKDDGRWRGPIWTTDLDEMRQRT